MQAIGKSIWWVFTVPLWLCGCQHDPYADWFVTKPVPEGTLVGSYHITDATLRHFATVDTPFVEGHRLPVRRDAKIILTSDHKISVFQVPLDWFDERGRYICVLNGAGTWKIAKHQEFSTVRVALANFKSSQEGCPDRDFGLDLELFDDSRLPMHSAAKYPLLHVTIGDPDSGDALQFEKD